MPAFRRAADRAGDEAGQPLGSFARTRQSASCRSRLASWAKTNRCRSRRARTARQLALASEAGGDPVPFLRYAIQGFVDGIRAQLVHVRLQQWADRWEQYVY